MLDLLVLYILYFDKYCQDVLHWDGVIFILTRYVYVPVFAFLKPLWYGFKSFNLCQCVIAEKWKPNVDYLYISLIMIKIEYFFLNVIYISCELSILTHYLYFY